MYVNEQIRQAYQMTEQGSDKSLSPTTPARHFKHNPL